MPKKKRSFSEILSYQKSFACRSTFGGTVQKRKRIILLLGKKIQQLGTKFFLVISCKVRAAHWLYELMVPIAMEVYA
jgi:hypothetical protein